MFIGYARVSTDEQNPQLQIDALKKAGVEDDYLFIEKKSGKDTKRPKLQEMFKILRQGDTLIVWKLDRLGRSVKDLHQMCDLFQERGVNLKCIMDPVDTGTATGKLFFSMLAAFAEFERNLISERTKAGLRASKKRGKNGGRKRALNKMQAKAAREMIDSGDYSAQDAADCFKVPKSTLYSNMHHYGFMEPPTTTIK